MNRMNRKTRSVTDYQKLEDRVYLAVTASVTPSGSLSVRGAADGDVEITNVGFRQYLVTDNGVDIATLNGVSRNMVVNLDSPGEQNNVVRIDLMDAVFENIVVELNSGDNDFQITGTGEARRVIYRGGNGDDTVVVNVDTEQITSVAPGGGVNSFTALANSNRFRFRGGGNNDTVTLGSAAAPGAFEANYAGIVLGNGQNVFSSYAIINTQQFVRGGDHADTILSFTVSGSALFPLGTGNNVLRLDGTYDNLFVRGGNDADAVFFFPSAVVNGRVGLILIGGDDFVRVDGTFNTDFFFNSTDGNDQVFFGGSTSVNGDVYVLLGADTNLFTHDGQTTGDLFVTSANINDNFRVNGRVDGVIRLNPGGQG